MENVLELKVVKEFIDACHQSWLKGWNERNGGNMSYRLKPEEAAEAMKHWHKNPGKVFRILVEF